MADAAAAAKVNRGRRALPAYKAPSAEPGGPITALIATMLFGILAMTMLSSKLSPATLRSARLLIVLIGGFGLVALLLPLAPRNHLLAIGLFGGLIGLFRMMSGFEKPKA